MFTASHLFRFNTSLPVEFLCFNMCPWEPLKESKTSMQQGILMLSYWKGINGLVCTSPHKVLADLNNSLDSPDVRVDQYRTKDQASDICLSCNAQTGFKGYKAWLCENHIKNLALFYSSSLILHEQVRASCIQNFLFHMHLLQEIVPYLQLCKSATSAFMPLLSKSPSNNFRVFC